MLIIIIIRQCYLFGLGSDSNVIIHFDDSSLFDYAKDCIKPIERISEYAIWVNENDEFDEEDLLCKISVREWDSEEEKDEYTDYKCSPDELDNYQINKHEERMRNKAIKVKCPTCKMFH